MFLSQLLHIPHHFHTSIYLSISLIGYSIRNYYLLNCFFFVNTGKGLSDNEMMAWRQLHLTAQQHKQILASPTSTPQQITSANDNGSARSLLSLQDVMLKHQQRFEKRRLSENDLDRDIKLPKLSPIENNICTSGALLPLSLTGFRSHALPSMMSNHITSNDKAFNMLMSHREKAQNQQYLDRLRRMNQRTHSSKERGSRVNFDQHNSAKTVREELANRKHRTQNGKTEIFLQSTVSKWKKTISHLLMATKQFSTIVCRTKSDWKSCRGGKTLCGEDLFSLYGFD